MSQKTLYRFGQALLTEGMFAPRALCIMRIPKPIGYLNQTPWSDDQLPQAGCGMGRVKGR